MAHTSMRFVESLDSEWVCNFSDFWWSCSWGTSTHWKETSTRCPIFVSWVRRLSVLVNDFPQPEWLHLKGFLFCLHEAWCLLKFEALYSSSPIGEYWHFSHTRFVGGRREARAVERRSGWCGDELLEPANCCSEVGAVDCSSLAYWLYEAD